jgi:hypothetical protein
MCYNGRVDYPQRTCKECWIMSDVTRLPEPGSSIHYVSVGVEKNSRSVNITAKASAWYNALPTETVGETSRRLAEAEAVSVAVASMTAQSAERMIEGGATDAQVQSFVDLVNRLANLICTGTLPEE